MELISTDIPGCYQIQLKEMIDDRGSFIKSFNHERFEELGLETDWKEEYYSISKLHVIRGMHFQVPPHDHNKLVCCLGGRVLDVVVDLRVTSPSFKKVISFELDDKLNQMIYIPKGCAHGFLSLQENSMLFYKVSSGYSPSHDQGILWDSIDFDWSVIEPIVSSRDKGHQSLSEFKSPFL